MFSSALCGGQIFAFDMYGIKLTVINASIVQPRCSRLCLQRTNNKLTVINASILQPVDSFNARIIYLGENALGI